MNRIDAVKGIPVKELYYIEFDTESLRTRYLRELVKNLYHHSKKLKGDELIHTATVETNKKFKKKETSE